MNKIYIDIYDKIFYYLFYKSLNIIKDYNQFIPFFQAKISTGKTMEEELIPIEQVESKIYVIRDQNVMLDRDLARLYGVETKVLKQAVRRNRGRFPGDFMFELSKEEFANWRSQFVTSNSDKMGLRYTPMVFTEHGVAMLSSVLNSERAIKINIQIMRAFTRIRKMLLNYEELKKVIIDLAKKHDEDVTFIFMELDRLNRLLELKKPKGQIGFQKDG